VVESARHGIGRILNFRFLGSIAEEEEAGEREKEGGQEASPRYCAALGVSACNVTIRRSASAAGARRHAEAEEEEGARVMVA